MFNNIDSRIASIVMTNDSFIIIIIIIIIIIVRSYTRGVDNYDYGFLDRLQRGWCNVYY